MFYSPLRYPGGKGKLAQFMKQVIEENGINDGTYVEPYAGGAAVALGLLLEERVWDVVINDIDRSIYAFWHCVLNETEWFLRKIRDTAVTMDEWQRQHRILFKYNEHSLKDLGFATFFLNRTNRSGILRGGVIGGQNQTGKYGIDARFNKPELCNRIERIARKRNRIRLFNLDAGQLLDELAPTIKRDAFFYFDPPYYKKGGLLYLNHYGHKEHQQMAMKIRSLNHPWIVTYDDVQEVAELYDGVDSIRFLLTYSAHMKRPKGAELMFLKGVNLPSLVAGMDMPAFTRYGVRDYGTTH